MQRLQPLNTTKTQAVKYRVKPASYRSLRQTIFRTLDANMMRGAINPTASRRSCGRLLVFNVRQRKHGYLHEGRKPGKMKTAVECWLVFPPKSAPATNLQSDSRLNQRKPEKQFQWFGRQLYCKTATKHRASPSNVSNTHAIQTKTGYELLQYARLFGQCH